MELVPVVLMGGIFGGTGVVAPEGANVTGVLGDYWCR